MTKIVYPDLIKCCSDTLGLLRTIKKKCVTVEVLDGSVEGAVKEELFVRFENSSKSKDESIPHKFIDLYHNSINGRKLYKRVRIKDV